MNNGEGSKGGYRQDGNKERVTTRPIKLQLKLDDKTQHAGTDIMSFKFERKTDIDSGKQLQNHQQQRQNYYLNYKAGQIFESNQSLWDTRLRDTSALLFNLSYLPKSNFFSF